MSGNVKVSIVVPAYKNPAGIRRLLESVSAQDFSDYEIVVSDDTQDDSVKDMCESISVKSGMKLRYKRHKVPSGAAANWNAALDMADGEYVKIMHHDDWFADRRSLGAFVSMLDNDRDAVMAFSGTYQVILDSDGREVSRSARYITENDAKGFEMDYRRVYLGNTIGAPSAVIVRNGKIKYDEKLSWLVDMEYYMDLLSGGTGFKYTTDPLVCIGISNSQLTNSCIDDDRRNIEEYSYVYGKYGLDSEPEFRKKLADIFAEHHATREDIGKCIIDASSLRESRREKRERDRKFWLGLVRRKLTRNE
jgi:glycosyltransferase involved in cell wall biosynthesis